MYFVVLCRRLLRCVSLTLLWKYNLSTLEVFSYETLGFPFHGTALVSSLFHCITQMCTLIDTNMQSFKVKLQFLNQGVSLLLLFPFVLSFHRYKPSGAKFRSANQFFLLLDISRLEMSLLKDIVAIHVFIVCVTSINSILLWNYAYVKKESGPFSHSELLCIRT